MHDAFTVKTGLPPLQTIAHASAAMPARYALERGDWRAAMLLEEPAATLPHTASITWFARGLGAARMADIAAAEQAAAQLGKLRKVLEEANNTYWRRRWKCSNRGYGMEALAQKNQDNALKLMRAAAELEDRNERHIVTPGPYPPSGRAARRHAHGG
jgi:hypothetical protein